MHAPFKKAGQDVQQLGAGMDDSDPDHSPLKLMFLCGDSKDFMPLLVCTHHSNDEAVSFVI